MSKDLRNTQLPLKYPIGVQSFEKMRTEGYYYIDKTASVYRLASSGSCYFFSRPRRFGKSLLLSTLKAYFEGKKDLFDGLAIADMEQEWITYPVLHIDFNTGLYTDSEGLVSVIAEQLYKFEQLYGSEPSITTLSGRFKEVIQRAYEQTGRKVVILVDEYDKPLLETIGNPDLQEEYRKVLKSFYGVVKTMYAYIRFAFFTGVTKFSKVSIFSDLNNLEDISLAAAYSTVCGITEKEIRDNFDAEVGLMADQLGIGKDECYDRLRKNYDGYHFRENSEGVYNPFSLLTALKQRDICDFWFATGTPTFLMETLKRSDYELENLTREEVTIDLFGSLDSIGTTPLPLLYQSGYLTINKFNPRFETYVLGFPNEEVERGFTRSLFRYFAPVRTNHTDSFIKGFTIEVEEGRPDKFMPRLEAFFAGQDYQVMGDAEVYFHNVTSLVFKMLGFYTDVERHTTDGRMDMLVRTDGYIYIFEFKIDKSADLALQQIDERQYAKACEQDHCKLFKIGVNFSTTTRRMDGWKVVKA